MAEIADHNILWGWRHEMAHMLAWAVWEGLVGKGLPACRVGLYLEEYKHNISKATVELFYLLATLVAFTEQLLYGLIVWQLHNLWPCM